jgi:putative membrane protein
MIDLKPNKAVVFSLLAFYFVLSIILSINPIERQTWLVENATVWIFVGALMYLYLKKIRFSTLSYILASVFIFMHTIGGHYTFAQVPFDWFTDFFGFSRNHYDRIAHFSIGLYAFLIMEWMTQAKLTLNRFILISYPILAIMSLAAFYELVEWVYASGTPDELAMAYLGSQGDIWDAQKDITADTLGAILAVIIFYFTGKNKMKSVLKTTIKMN